MTKKQQKSTNTIYTYDPSSFALSNLMYSSLAGGYKGISNYRIERPFYNSMLVMCIEEGELIVQVGERSIKASAGCFVFLDCRQPHSYHSEKPVMFRWIHLQGDSVFPYADIIVDRFLNPACLQDGAMIQEEFDILYGLMQAETRLEHSTAVAIHRMLAILAERVTLVSNSREQAVIAAGVFLRKNFMNAISVNDAAEIAHMSVYHFTRQFRKQHGMSPYEFLTMQRISEAKQLLLTTHMSTKEIAFACGYNSSSTFIHAFRTRTQMTPSKFRSIEL